MVTSVTRLACDRAATYGGRQASADDSSTASTVHHSSCPPLTHEASADRRRKGLSNPFHAAKTTGHSMGVWR